MTSVTDEQAAAARLDRQLRALLVGFTVLLLPLGWLAMRYDRYAIDGDAVSYMDIADLLHAHRWGAAVNGYWHPLYPALLWCAQVVFHTTPQTELQAYYRVNFGLLLLQVGAMLFFVDAMVRLRERSSHATLFLLSRPALQLTGLSLLVFAIMRELTLGKVRTDSLLQALILMSLAWLMRSLSARSEALRFCFATGMGLTLGFAYLTKSIAFILALLCVVVLVSFAALVQKRPFLRAALPGMFALLAFGLVSGPYILALSRQKHRFDFGDSGSLNYVWYVSGTEKMHLEPWMRGSFGSATVQLVHPERQVMAEPGVYSYKDLPYGTYPPWFDSTYFNERITPKFNLRLLLARDTRNLLLVGRYLANHPEPLILLAVLLATGATLRSSLRFLSPVAALGVALWLIYATVNIEERYVTVAYFAVLLPLFAILRPQHRVPSLELKQSVSATVLIALFSCLALGELLRSDLLNRRDEIIAGQLPAWRSAPIYGAAEALSRMGLKPGDQVACVGTVACIDDPYWARLAGVRILTELYRPQPEHLIDQLGAMPNLPQVYEVVHHEGARALVGVFDPGEMNALHPAASGWVRLGQTPFYALSLDGGHPRD